MNMRYISPCVYMNMRYICYSHKDGQNGASKLYEQLLGTHFIDPLIVHI